MASLLLNFIQFSFKWPVPLQYWQESSGFREPSILGPSCGGWASPNMVCQYNHSCHYSCFVGLLPPPIFTLLATTWVIVLTRSLGSKSWVSFLFWASRLLIFDAQWLILFCLCWKFFDNWGSHDSSDITEEVVYITVAQELIWPDLLQLLNVNAKGPWNWVKCSVWSEVCSALWTIAA